MSKTLIALAVLGMFSTTSLAADSSSKWTFRGSIANVSPNDSSGNVLGTDDGVTVDGATATGLSLTYHFDNNWGLEILAATPFSHDINGTGSLAGLAIGDTKQLPPTVSAVYQWGEQTKYHVGAGINHTVFFDSGTTQALTDALGADSTDLDLSASTGIAFTAGFDTPISDNWYFSGTVYWADINTDADVIVNGNVATTVDVEIDPWVYMLGISTRF